MSRAAALPDLSRAVFVSERDLARACGLKWADWEIAKRRLAHEGLPAPDPVVGGYWSPAVKAFFDKRFGVAAQSDLLRPDGQERW